MERLQLVSYLTLLNLAIACGAPRLDEPSVTPVSNPRKATQQTPEIDEELLEAVQQWKEDCYKFSSLHCGSLFNRVDSIKLTSTYEEEKKGEYPLGQCKLKTYAVIVVRREITIRRDLLKSPNSLRAVLAHELGHCVFLRNHVENERENLMAPYMLPEKVLDAQLPTMLQRFYQQIEANELPKIGVFDE